MGEGEQSKYVLKLKDRYMINVTKNIECGIINKFKKIWIGENI